MFCILNREDEDEEDEEEEEEGEEEETEEEDDVQDIPSTVRLIEQLPTARSLSNFVHAG